MARKLFDNRLLSIINPDSSIEVGAKLYWRIADTNTPVTTYSDPVASTANANPLLAGSDGRFGSIWLEPGDYKYILTQSDSDPSDPDVTQNDYTVEDAPPSFDADLYDFLAGDDPLPIANGGTNSTSAVNALAALGALGLVGGTVTGNITRSGKGTHLYHDASAMTGGGVFLTASATPDPTSAAGQIWLKY